MIRERVAENIYIFTSELYAQVNAGAVVGPNWSVLIDTLVFPSEVIEIKKYLEDDLSSPVRYVINTHYHSDHSFGNAYFPQAAIISHARCRELLDTRGRERLEAAKLHSKELRDTEIRLPEIVFSNDHLMLQVANRSLKLIPLPGHSPDGIGVLIVEDRVLFSGDLMMPLPYLPDGDYDQMVDHLKQLPKMKLENLVQGHGEPILRGEVAGRVKDNLSYLSALRRHVQQAARRKNSQAYLDQIGVEDCGKSRILLGGLAESLHERNMIALLHQLHGED
jgi:glyoxylase-like metal-dependent hydrolase (beta-lactamase superfamily II)